MYILLISLLLFGCEKNQDKVITFINNTDKTICWKIGKSYPDTSLNMETTKWIGTSRYTEQAVNPHSKGSFIEGDNKEAWFSSNFVKDTIMIFIFDKYVLIDLPWEKVKNEYLVLKRYDLSLADLQRMNWTLTYP